MAQVHTVTNDAGVTRMREAKAVAIPAGKIVTFAPQGGLHIMLMGAGRLRSWQASAFR